MDTAEGVVSNDARIPASRQVPLMPERRHAVATACQEAAAALDGLSQALIETARSDDPSIESATLRLDTTVSVLRRTACEGLPDMQEKWRIFRRLEELLSPSDPRVQLFIYALVYEMAAVSWTAKASFRATPGLLPTCRPLRSHSAPQACRAANGGFDALEISAAATALSVTPAFADGPQCAVPARL